MHVVLIPGWNEAADDLQLLVRGRRDKRGFEHYGYECVTFGEAKGGLCDRIDQFGDFLLELGRKRPGALPVASFGYSAGGLIGRGFLRAHPERANEIAATFQVGVPNGGVVTDDLAALLRLLRVSGDVIEDVDIESDFMMWLNGTLGHWEAAPEGKKRWKLDAVPWVAPAGAKILNMIGRPPRYARDSDGIVTVDSASLEGRLPHEFVDEPTAYHLNLCGLWNPLTLLFRRWRADDVVWPAVVARAAAFFGEAKAESTVR